MIRNLLWKKTKNIVRASMCVCVCEREKKRLCACLWVCDSESLWLCECDFKQLFIFIMFKSTMGLYRPFVISLIIIIFILLNSLAFHSLRLYFSPFLGVAVIARGQGNFFHIFCVSALWCATWIPVFGGVFYSPAEFQFKYSKWSDKFVMAVLMWSSSPLATEDWLSSKESHSCLLYWAVFTLSLRNRASIVCRAQVVIDCLLRSGKVKVSFPLLYCWHFRSISALWTRITGGWMQLCSLWPGQVLTDYRPCSMKG
jgi:hypothetical protein